ncbi:MAG: diguanylate cyclase [Gammaproteobacteria bacterium]
MKHEKNNDNSTEALDELYRHLHLYQERLGTVVDLAADFYWETDTNHCLTYYWSRDAGSSEHHQDPLRLLGKKHRELGEMPSGNEADWNEHLLLRETRQPFSGFLHKYIHPELGLRYVRLSGKPVFNDNGEFTGYCGVARDVTEEVESERLLQLETHVLRYISDKESVNDAIRGAMQMICESQYWEAGSFWEVDEKAGVLRYKAGWASQENEIVARIMSQAKDFHFERGEGLPGWVWETGNMLHVADIKNDSRMGTTEITDLTGWNAAFLFPVMLEGKFLGVLDFYAPSIPEPTGRLLQVIRMLGIEIGHYYQRALTMEQLRESEARFRSLTELSSDWYWEQDGEFRFTRFEGRGKAMIDFMRREYIGKRSWDIDDERSNPENMATNALRIYMENHEPFRDVILYRKIDADQGRYVSVSGEPVYDERGNFCGYRGVARDVTEQKQAEEKIQYLATHDTLTGLPNRALFSQLLNYSIETARRYDRGFAVLFLDLDGFKRINDTLGHHAGDRLLVEVSERISNGLRDSDVLARMGGDEFVILAQEACEKEQIDRVANNVLAAVRKPVVIQNQECRVTVSIGICIYPEDAQDEDTILKQADTAMYMAKQKGKNNHHYSSP